LPGCCGIVDIIAILKLNPYSNPITEAWLANMAFIQRSKEFFILICLLLLTTTFLYLVTFAKLELAVDL